MTSIVHDFNTSLEAGEEGEEYLDRLFSKWYNVVPASVFAQREGIDRHFQPLNDRTRIIAVEYKTDARAGQTGNAFLETISVSGRKQGWAYTSRAEILVYRVTEPETIYILRMADVRRMMEIWSKTCREVKVQNRTYTTHGLLVPLRELEKIAIEVW